MEQSIDVDYRRAGLLASFAAYLTRPVGFIQCKAGVPADFLNAADQFVLALFGGAEPLSQAHAFPVQDTYSDIATPQSAKTAEKKKVVKAFTPRLKVTLRVGNVFEGKMNEMVHAADTLSTSSSRTRSYQGGQEEIPIFRSSFRKADVA